MRNTILFIFGLFLLFSFLGYQFTIAIEATIAIVLIGIIGMAHGSIDHILAVEVLKIMPRKNMSLFVFAYVTLVLIYLVFWFYFPLLSFFIFLLYSAYHFGQADTEDLSHNISSFTKKVLALNHGVAIISLLFIANHTALLQIVSEWFSSDDLLISLIHKSTLIFTTTLVIETLFLIFLFTRKLISTNELANFLVQFVFIILIFYYLPTLISFSLYFGLWHSLWVLKKEYHELGKLYVKTTFKGFLFKLLPFTLLSVVGFFTVLFLSNGDSYFSVLVLISVVALPHTILMDQIYNKQSNERENALIVK
jgi:Brp/Blh family beta-carotene 15,15'-monooxygenase